MSDRLYSVPTELSAIGPRRSGRTTAICHASLAIGAVVVCPNQALALKLSETFKVRAVGMDVPARYRGMNGPFLFEHSAVEALILDFDACVRELIQTKVALGEAQRELSVVSKYVAPKRKKVKP